MQVDDPQSTVKTQDITSRSNEASGSISAQVDADIAAASGADHAAGSQEAIVKAALPDEPAARMANEFDIKSAEVRISVAESNADMHRKEKEALVQQVAELNQQVQVLLQGKEHSGPTAATSAEDSDSISEASGKSTRRGSQGRKGKVCVHLRAHGSMKPNLSAWYTR